MEASTWALESRSFCVLTSTLPPAFVAALIHLSSYKAVLEECWSCTRRSLLRIHHLKMPSRHCWTSSGTRYMNGFLLLDANGRVGQDHRCTESHETTNDWVSAGPDGSEVTSPNEKRLVLICEQGGLVLANTWKGAAPTCHTPRSPDDHRIDNRPDWR